MKTDTTVFELIEKEHQRQLKGIELIASENFVSDEVMKAMGSWLTNQVCRGVSGKEILRRLSGGGRSGELGHRTGYANCLVPSTPTCSLTRERRPMRGIFGLSEAG